MKTIPISVPDLVDVSDGDLKCMLASKLYEERKLSLGQAADVAGMSKRTFIEELGRYGVSLFNMNAEELAEDFANA